MAEIVAAAVSAGKGKEALCMTGLQRMQHREALFSFQRFLKTEMFLSPVAAAVTRIVGILSKISEALDSMEVMEEAKDLQDRCIRLQGNWEIMGEAMSILQTNHLYLLQGHIDHIEGVLSRVLDTFEEINSLDCNIFCGWIIKLPPRLAPLRQFVLAKGHLKKIGQLHDKLDRAHVGGWISTSDFCTEVSRGDKYYMCIRCHINYLLYPSHSNQ